MYIFLRKTSVTKMSSLDTQLSKALSHVKSSWIPTPLIKPISFYSTLLAGASCNPTVLLFILLLGESSNQCTRCEESLGITQNKSVESQNLISQDNTSVLTVSPIVLALIYGEAGPSNLRVERQLLVQTNPKRFSATFWHSGHLPHTWYVLNSSSGFP